jgi:hypothetical protein
MLQASSGMFSTVPGRACARPKSTGLMPTHLVQTKFAALSLRTYCQRVFAQYAQYENYKKKYIILLQKSGGSRLVRVEVGNRITRWMTRLLSGEILGGELNPNPLGLGFASSSVGDGGSGLW